MHQEYPFTIETVVLESLLFNLFVYNNNIIFKYKILIVSTLA